MSTAVLNLGAERNSIAFKALSAAAGLWFVTAVAGQWMFVFYIASFYGYSVARGRVEVWNKTLAHGWVAGDGIGNGALAVHLLLAAMITLSGALQITSQVRRRFPLFHRWNGRLYVLAAFIMGVSGLYLLFSGRRVVGNLAQHVPFGINGVLILVCAALAWRYAMVRDFASHRRWALRLFLVVSGVWFFRVGLMFWIVLNKGPVGFNPATFEGPFITFLSFAQYLLPLAVLELYMRARERAGSLGRFATAAGLFILTGAMGVGIVAATMGMWLPRVKAAYDPRTSISDTLSATIGSRGIDAAIKQYADLKATQPGSYNFDEGELNSLGYQLMHANKFPQAIRILQLNVQAYPQSSNVYDSLAEAYMDDGNKALAIANYKQSLQLNPKNRGAAEMLQKLSAP